MIRIERLTKDFVSSSFLPFARTTVHRAVDEVSFTCHPGRVLCLLGPNGAGKTTTLRLIATMLRPTRGSVLVDGIDARSRPEEARRRIGFLTGATALYDRLTPDEIVEYYGQLHNVDRATIEAQRKRLYDLFDMHGYASTRIARLSTGMKQKVSIVRAMIHDPQVVVFDEVTSGLDVLSARSIIQLVRRCRAEGRTVIFSTHRMDEVSLLADDVVVMAQGKVRFAGTFHAFARHRDARSIENHFIRLVEAA